MAQITTSHAIIITLLIVAVLFSVLSIMVAFSLTDFRPGFQLGGSQTAATGIHSSDVKIIINPPQGSPGP